MPGISQDTPKLKKLYNSSVPKDDKLLSPVFIDRLNRFPVSLFFLLKKALIASISHL